MNSTYVLIALGGAAVGFLVSWLLARAQFLRQSSHIRQLDASLNDREREAFRSEREHREEVKRLDVEHTAALKQERQLAFEEGRKLGQTEGQRDHIVEMTTKVSEFEDRLRKERTRAAEEAREHARAEFEHQSKLFAVKISPFVQIREFREFLKTKYEAQTGYQYQLLVNGIPAFQPHVVIESIETRTTVNDENVKQLIALAEKATQLAIQMYLGTGGQFVQLAETTVRRVGR